MVVGSITVMADYDAGFSKLTNEVQRQVMVLPRERAIRQLAIVQRSEIVRLSAAQCSVRQIAAALDRALSTISRDLKRNATATATTGGQSNGKSAGQL